MSKIEVTAVEPQCGTTLTLGASGDTVTLGSGASQSGFGRTGTVNWDTTAKTASFTAVSGNGYFVNTTSGAITVTAPASPSAGDIFGIKDYASTFATNNVTVGRNSSKFDGADSDPTLSENNLSVFFVYVDSTQGWKATQSDAGTYGSLYVAATGGTITTCGDFKIHTFTGPGTFTVSCAGNPAGNDQIEYLVVAGGAGAGYDIGGGGGAGGVRFASPSLSPLTYPAKPLAAPAGLTAVAQGYPITVGAGGTSRSSQGVSGPNDGSNSVFSTITSAGGGGGGSGPGGPPNAVGSSGGSGGGAGNGPGTASGGTGNTPPVSPAQGSDGGDQPGHISGAGGGGFTQAGQDAQPGDGGGYGGDGGGFPTGFGSNGEPCGSFRYYAGGGGGGGRSPSYGPAGSGGKGGGGDGVKTGAGNAGTANTGGGAGGPSGSSIAQAGAGGSGIVVIRYKFQN